MSIISNALESLKDDFTASDDLINSIYDKYFSDYFKKEQTLYDRFTSNEVPITDNELEWIITVLPLNLIAVSNQLAQFKSHNEIVKLTIKQNKGVESNITDEEYKIMSIIYSAVISRVEHEISFSKELIMGAKKVWDSRRRSEQANPISEVSELPDYTPTNKTYITGESYV